MKRMKAIVEREGRFGGGAEGSGERLRGDPLNIAGNERSTCRESRAHLVRSN